MSFRCEDGTEKTGSHWKQYGGKPVVLIDFHHTISKRCGACDGEVLDVLSAGEPQEGCREALTKLHETFRLYIYTGYPYLEEVRNYLNKHGIPFDVLVPKPHQAAFIIDDRAIHHLGWQETLDELDRRSNCR